MSRFTSWNSLRRYGSLSHCRSNSAAMSTHTVKEPLDYSRFVNPVSSSRKQSKIREITKIYASAPPNTVFFAGGLPNPGTFPFAATKISLKDGNTFTLEGKSLESALQYQPTSGYPPLVKKLKELQLNTHNPPNWDDYELIVTAGSQDGLCKAFEMSLEEGEPVIVQDPIYPGALGALKPFHPQFLCIPEDKDGICPEILSKTLESCFRNKDINAKRGVPKEDPVSFLSMDTEGRVLRFDSFSKVLSAGIRLGFVTGPKHLITRIELHIQVSSLHTSSLSQVIAYNLLELWGREKLHKHLESVRSFYKSKRDMMLRAADKHLTGLAEWNVPTAGMFLWIKVKGVKDTYDMVTVRGAKKNVLFVPGNSFMADSTMPCQYIRASFTVPSEEEIDRGMASLAELIKEEQSLQK